jgi:hypothetical protein
MVEIYNENVRDLMRDQSVQSEQSEFIDVRQGRQGVHLPDAVTTEVRYTRVVILHTVVILLHTVLILQHTRTYICYAPT